MEILSLILIIKTQKELDKIPLDYDGTIYLEGGTYEKPLELKVNFQYAYVVARRTAYLNMWESSQVKEMRESSQVGVMRGSSQVGVMWESSQVGVMWGSSQVGVMWESSQVKEMRGSSQVKEMRGSSQVKLYGEAMVSAYSAESIVCHGYNVVRIFEQYKEDVKVKLNKDSHLIIIPKFKPTFEEFEKRYPAETKNTNVILYKAVHKKSGQYFADYNKDFEYIVGKTHEHENDKSTKESCSFGLHVACKSWAIYFGHDWSDFALLECEVAIRDIVVAEDCDGKVRTSKLKVLREVPKEEYFN